MSETADERRARIEAVASRWADRARSDDGARAAFFASLAASIAVLVFVGRDQWFIRDDWAVLIGRRRIEHDEGLLEALLRAQDGHWMTVPTAVYRVTESLFGLGSYWPFLAVCQAVHVGIVLCVRALCTRIGASAWTTTVVCSLLLVLGSGWENIVFAIQITYNFSLLAFLLQLLLVDRDGSVGRRDALGSLLAVVGVASSGFGPVFVAGVALLLALRRRWTALVVGVAPAAIAYVWWWTFHGDDPAAEQVGRPLGQIPQFVNVGVTSVFEALTPGAALVGIAMLGTTAVVVWPRRDPEHHALVVALGATFVVMLVGLAVQRVGFGVEIAGSARYVYVGAMIVAPVYAVAIDQLHRLGQPVKIAVLIGIAAAASVQVGRLHQLSGEWADRSATERRRLELIAAVELPPSIDPTRPCLDYSADVSCGDVARLVERGAIRPSTPATEAEQAFVDQLRAGVLAP